MKRLLIYVVLCIMFFIPYNTNALEDTSIFVEVAKEEKYYKTTTYETNIARSVNDVYSITEEITKEEYEAYNPSIEPNSSASTTTTYKKLTTYILANGNYYRYKATLTWRNIPKVRSYDTIGIGHYSSVVMRGSTSFSQTYCLTSGSCTTVSSYYPKTSTTGAAATFKIPSGDLSSLSQTFYFDVEKRDESLTVVSQIATGDYSHAIETVTTTQAQNFTIGSNGITYASSVVDSYDEINYARAEWTGSW